MDELDFDPEHFQFSEVPWIVAYRERAEGALAGQPYFLGGQTDDGCPFVALFSDQDLAERFIVLADMQGHSVAVRFPSLGHLITFLRAIPAHAYTHVVLDPARERGSERVCTVDELREALEDAISGPEAG
jgi:hypothetical protein